MTKDEALKLALEIMQYRGDVNMDEWIAAEKAIKEALAQRTWIGLTGFEQKELMAMSARDAVFATEAKLKQKERLRRGEEHMTAKDKALKRAQELMQKLGDVSVDEWIAAEKAIREALAQPDVDRRSNESKEIFDQQEPVIDKSAAVRIATALGWEPKRTWVGLTDEDMKDALVSVDAETKRLPPGFRDFARAIEAKLKEKNT